VRDVRLEGIVKQFGKVRAVDGVDLEIRESEFLVFLGPSGCGKTTTLRCIAGLETVDAGRILIGGRDVTQLPPGKRGIGMVFQSYALFPHMNVAANIGFGLRIKGVERSEIDRRVRRAAELLQLGNLLDRYPGQLSGGQRQRVAVARAVVVEPDVLLMDEPLSNLDALLRLSMRAEIKRLQQEIRATTVYVTHDQVEALSLGDRIAVMSEGKIVQLDEPQVVYDDPATVFVGAFIGNPPMNFLTGRVREEAGEFFLLGDGFIVPFTPEEAARIQAAGIDRVTIGIRPENISVSLNPPETGFGPHGSGGIAATVIVSELLGAQRMLTLGLGPHTLKVTTPPDFMPPRNGLVWLTFDARKVRLFDAGTQRRLAPLAKAS